MQSDLRLALNVPPHHTFPLDHVSKSVPQVNLVIKRPMYAKIVAQLVPIVLLLTLHPVQCVMKAFCWL